jgi:uncharacterized protein (TIGR02246 family)
MKKAANALLLVAILLWTGPAWARESPGQVLDQRFLAAFNANDLESILACYADDAVIYPPGEFMARGKDEMRESWRKFLAEFRISNARIHDARYVDMGSTCVGWGICEFDATPTAGGEAKPFKARFTSVSEKRQGKWVFISDHASVPM